ncbi:PhzF family phenazine biosynthesis protein [Cupriavidus necator]
MMREQNRTARATGVVIFGECSPNSQGRVEVRALAPSCVVNQDPVYGSGNGTVAAFLQYTSQIGRAGSIHLALRVDCIQVGGATVTCFDGNTAI